ncbi:hypothetical protein JRC04_07820 [Mycolicibacterium sp. S2-37]|nr:hypothetical protein [Mycolicibacterium sp. S2-37]
MGDCTGLWRRTLLIDADGTRDTGTDVVWLQGLSAYVDSRGFAGVLRQRGRVFQWQRDIDTGPTPPTPDVGTMHRDGDTLVEEGVHSDYVEHWVRDPGPGAPVWAATLRSPLGAALLLRVGDTFGWATPRGVTVDRVNSPRWAELAPERMNGQLRADGVRWSLLSGEGNLGL